MNNFLSITLLVASAGIFLGYINPTYTAATGSVDNGAKSVQELQALEKDYNDAFSKTLEIQAIYDRLLTKYNTISGTANDDKIMKLLPDHIDSVRLIIDMNNIAFKYGMSLSNILLTAPGVQNTAVKSSAVSGQSAGVSQTQAQAEASLSGPGPDYRLYDSVKLSFSVTGSYGNFISFLKELESSLRLVDIISLSFAANQSVRQTPLVSSPASDMYTYSITVKTYYLK